MEKIATPAAAATIAAAMASYAGVSSKRADQLICRLFRNIDADMAFTATSIRAKGKRSFC